MSGLDQAFIRAYAKKTVGQGSARQADEQREHRAVADDNAAVDALYASGNLYRTPASDVPASVVPAPHLNIPGRPIPPVEPVSTDSDPGDDEDRLEMPPEEESAEVAATGESTDGTDTDDLEVPEIQVEPEPQPADWEIDVASIAEPVSVDDGLDELLRRAVVEHIAIELLETEPELLLPGDPLPGQVDQQPDSESNPVPDKTTGDSCDQAATGDEESTTEEAADLPIAETPEPVESQDETADNSSDEAPVEIEPQLEQVAEAGGSGDAKAADEPEETVKIPAAAIEAALETQTLDTISSPPSAAPPADVGDIRNQLPDWIVPLQQAPAAGNVILDDCLEGSVPSAAEQDSWLVRGMEFGSSSVADTLQWHSAVALPQVHIESHETLESIAADEALSDQPTGEPAAEPEATTLAVPRAAVAPAPVADRTPVVAPSPAVEPTTSAAAEVETTLETTVPQEVPATAQTEIVEQPASEKTVAPTPEPATEVERPVRTTDHQTDPPPAEIAAEAKEQESEEQANEEQANEEQANEEQAEIEQAEIEQAGDETDVRGEADGESVSNEDTAADDDTAAETAQASPELEHAATAPAVHSAPQPQAEVEASSQEDADSANVDRRPLEPAWEVDRFAWPDLCNQIYAREAAYFDHAGKKLHAAAEQGLQVLAVTSSQRGEGRTTLALCLARAAAAAGVRVALLDADLERPQLALSLGIDTPCDWRDAIAGDSDLGEVAVRGVEDDMILLPLPNDGGGASVGLSDPRVTRLLRRMTTHLDLIIIDTPPVGDPDGELFETGDACPINAAILVRDMRIAVEPQTLKVVRRLYAAGIQAVGLAQNYHTGKAA